MQQIFITLKIFRKNMLEDENLTQKEEYILLAHNIEPKQLRIYKSLLLAVAYTAGIGGILL